MDNQERIKNLQRILSVFEGSVELNLVQDKLDFRNVDELSLWLLDCKLDGFKVDRGAGSLLITSEGVIGIDEALAEMEEQFGKWDGNIVDSGEFASDHGERRSVPAGRTGSTDKINQWFEEAEKLKEHRMFEEAEKFLRKIVDLEPMNSTAWYLIADIIMEFNHHNDALKAINNCLKIDPANFNAWEIKETIYDSIDGEMKSEDKLLKTRQKLLVQIEKMLITAPNDGSLWERKGNVLKYLEQYDDAQESYKRAVRLNPSNQSAWLGRSVALRFLSRFDDSLRCVNKAVELDPEDSSGYLIRCLALAATGNTAEALSDIEKSIELIPNTESNFLECMIKYRLMKKLKGKRNKEVKKYLEEIVTKEYGKKPSKHDLKYYSEKYPLGINIDAYSIKL